jgi:acyl dehydratase
MSMSTHRGALAAGTEFRLAPRLMTRERMRWYVDIQETVQQDTGRIVTQPPTIHDDDAYAKKQGLPGIIADGMISTNWIFGLLVDVFGPEAGHQGRLRTKYIAPIYEDDVVVTCGKIISAIEIERGETVYQVEVWCEGEGGKKLTVGEAVVHAKRA